MLRVRPTAQESGGAVKVRPYNAPMTTDSQFQLVSKALAFLSRHREEQPDLAQLAAAVGVSPGHLQRTFQRWAGVSPKQFLKALNRDTAIDRLKRGASVLEAAIDTGLSGPGRLHDLLVTTESLTPGEVRRHGQGVSLRYGFGECVFGRALLAWTPRGLNFLGFCNEFPDEAAFDDLRARWRQAEFRRDDRGASEWLDRIFADSRETPLALWLRGSPFQLKVWEALLSIPENAAVSYHQLARAIGKPGAARAVGNAVGANPIAWLIPCHRVIRQAGELGGYHWGVGTKRALLAFEQAREELSRRP